MDSYQLLGQYLLTGINLMVVLTVLVAVHELGHYWVARLFGMQVDAFAVMMGGIRRSDLASRLSKPLLPSRWVWLAAAVAASGVIVGTFERIAGLHLGGLAALAVVIPVWVATRIGALYGFPLAQSVRYLAVGWFAGFLALYFSTKLNNLQPGQVLTVLLFASSIALLVLYYQPVLRKPEDSKMGEGELEIGGQRVEVPFRPLWSRRAKNGTEFSFLALPLGGFAAIKGMHPKADGSETKIAGGFYSKSPFARFLVLLAGPVFSIAFGLLLYVLLFTTIGIERPLNEPVIGAVAEGKAAAKAGLIQGDRVVSIDGKPVETFFQIIEKVRQSPNVPMAVVYERKGQRLATTVVPELDEAPSPVITHDLDRSEAMAKQAKWGAVWQTRPERLGLGEAFAEAWTMPVRMAAGLFGLVKNPGRAKDEVGGVGTIAKATYQATEAGLSVVLMLAAGLSISLGFMNLLPVPPLDGGQMVVAFVEMLRGGRRLSIQVQNAVSTVGMVLVFALIASVLTIDMGRFLGQDAKDAPPVTTPTK
ncbi:MAG TPA: site-2 protease family protein [Fimbriimonadaceae bacterium]|nr:site-2 protease family protein [Fimbriimonadaceae bacterium]HRJ95428.1 site-2 protease family protein [Fimbriimonadaceae bacterium]